MEIGQKYLILICLDCCYKEASLIGEVTYKGEYTFDTAWKEDVITKQCFYPKNGNIAPHYTYGKSRATNFC